MTLTLARDVHGACPRCPQPSWHGPSGCPLWGAAPERERPVECRLFECRQVTTRNDGACSDEHALMVRARCTASQQVREAGEGSATHPFPGTSSPTGAYSTALQPPVGDLRT